MGLSACNGEFSMLGNGNPGGGALAAGGGALTAGGGAVVVVVAAFALSYESYALLWYVGSYVLLILVL